jgi:hypothetical protein
LLGSQAPDTKYVRNDVDHDIPSHLISGDNIFWSANRREVDLNLFGEMKQPRKS